MKSIPLTQIAVLLSLLSTLLGCVKDSHFSTPPLDCQAPVQANTSLAQLLQSYSGRLRPIDKDLIFPAYVISSDRARNFYKALRLQAVPANPTSSGIEIDMDATDLYLDYPIGTELLIEAKELYLDGENGAFRLGYPYLDSQARARLGRIDATDINQHIYFSCNPITAITPKTYNQLSEVKADKNTNTLVRLNDVEFTAGDTDKTYADKRADANRHLIDKNGDQLILRSSRYADFAQQKLPDGSGSITGVMGKYGSHFQLYIRDLSDVQLDKPRFKGKTAETTQVKAPTKTETPTKSKTRTKAATSPEVEAPVKATYKAGIPPCTGEFISGFTNLCYLRNQYPTKAGETLENRKIKVVVTSDNRGGNIYPRNVAVQDQTAGIILHFDCIPPLTKPDSLLEVDLSGAKLSVFHGQLQIDVSCSNMKHIGVQPVKPKVITIAELNTNQYESMLVELDDVTYTQPGIPFYSGEGEYTVHELQDETGITTVYVHKGVTFASVAVPLGTVSVIGNAGSYDGKAQLLPRNTYDTVDTDKGKEEDSP